MRRRDLVIGAAAATLAAPNVARSQTPKVRWRLVSSFPRSLKLLFKGCTQFAKRVEELTGGAMEIQVFAGGEIVPPLGVFDAVSGGTVECGHTLSLYYTGKNKALAFESGVPFGMTARQHSAWMLAGGGLELTRELMAKHNIINFPFGNTGAQMGGWFRKEIKSLADLKGVRMRIPGLGSFVLSRLGVVPQNIPAGDTFAALERGTIDAVEWVGPYDDEVLGYYKVAKYYYFPGFWDCAAQNSLYVNLAAWDALPPQFRSAIEVASHESYTTMLADYDANNMQAMRRLIANGVELKAFPKDFMEAAYKETFQMYEEDQKQNPDFAKIYGPWLDFREKIINWFRISEGSYEFFVYNQRKG
jgi:TRAP-type mannitol/chloroaromatic compound transport system substrate-binding protein